MDSLIIVAAFMAGFAARQIGQPPLVGYLIAGFILAMAGIESTPAIAYIADIGILLMLLQAIATFFKDLAKARGEKI